MESLDLQVLELARDWVRSGHQATLVTVIETWGSAPRPPGALLAVRDDGLVMGSVSGGCVEDDLIARVRDGERLQQPGLITYGVTKDEAARFGLPCGGTLRLVQEPLTDIGWIDEVLQCTKQQQLVARVLDLDTGLVRIESAQRGEGLSFDGRQLRSVFGPKWRLLIIGAGQLSRVLAGFALAVDFQVFVCDPRDEYFGTWDLPNTTYQPGMPDDVVVAMQLDPHAAVVALTHDPKLDDLALMEALKSPAFYIGALGSRLNTRRRKERLLEFDVTDAELARLHGPIGLDIGSRTPAEIAISIMAEIVAVKNEVALLQKKPGSAYADRRDAQNGPICGLA